MDNYISLFDLPMNENGVVKSVNCKPRLKKRFEDLGVIEGVVITPLIKSPFGDPRAYGINNTVIAIRNRDAKKIDIKTGISYE